MKSIGVISLILCPSVFGQQSRPVTVVATSLVITAHESKHSSVGHSYTSCSGNSSAFGSFANGSVNCSTTEQPPTETTIEHHIYTYYTVVRDSENSYLLSCTRKFIWDKCPAIIAGQTYSFDTKGSKVLLTDGAKINKLDLVQSVPTVGIVSPSQNVAAVAGQSATAPPSATVHVRVSSNADGSDISVDGNFVGSAPSDLQLTPGKHTVVVSHDGYTSWQRELTVSTGEINLVATLQPTAPTPK